MYSVLTCLTTQHDYRLVLLAALICMVAAFTTFRIYARATETRTTRDTEYRRLAWLFLTGLSTGSGIWATHFVAMLAYASGFPTAYDPVLTIASMVIAVGVTTVAFAISARGGRHMAVGGAVVGAGVSMMHYTGMLAVIVPGRLQWSMPLVAVSVVVGMALATAAMLAYQRLQRAYALWAAPLLLTAAICAMHFTAMGAVSIIPDPTVVARPSVIDHVTMALGIAGVTLLVMFAAVTAAFIHTRAQQEAELELRSQHEILREQEAELRTQNLRFDTALTNMPHGLCVVDRQRRLVVCNQRYAELYALPVELTRPGTPIRDILQHRIDTGIYAGDAEAYLAERLEAVIQPSVKTYQLSGGRTVSVTRRPTLDNGWIAIHEDITERRHLEETERQARETLAAVFDAVPVAVMCVSPDRRILVWSGGAERMFGYSAEEAMGQRYRLVPPEGQAQFEALFQRALAGETLRNVQVRRLHKNGTLVDVSFSCAAMYDRDGTMRGIVYALDDITERQQLNALLEGQNELLEQREDALEAQNEQLDAALANMAHGLAMFDAQERLVLANDRYAELYGLSPELVKRGMTLRQLLQMRIDNGLYPGRTVDELLAVMRERIARRSVNDLISVPSHGRMLCVAIQPRSDGGWVATVHDITEQERLKQRLEAQNEQLDAALNNMSQGLAMFDAEQRLVVCNKLYAEMYGLTPAQVTPGTTVRQIFDYRMANGFYHVRDSGEFVDSWANDFGKRSSRIQELADGRIVSVSRRQMANGGRVVTHEDVSERQKLIARLEQQHRALEAHEEKLRAQNVQLDAAINNMVQGLAMFDHNLDIVIANDRYREMYGLTPEQVKPGTPLQQIIEHRIANGDLPGMNAADVVQAMLSRVSRKREGQYTSQMSDGRYIVVSSKPMPDGCTVTTHHDITEQRRSEAKIAHMALHDALTGLPNRVLLNERLEQSLARVKRGEIMAAHLLDLDHFKNVNDTLGHPAGDKLLRLVTQRLHALVRETDTIARMGGDEFAILQVAVAQPADATALAMRIIEALSEPYDIDGHQVVIGTSVGIAIGPADGTNPDQLMRNADLALYRAKGDGRGTYRFFEPEMDAQMQERRAMEYDLRKALVAGEFELYYQPIVNLESNIVTGFEALIRWHHPDKGMVPPATFIPLAEEIGFIVPLGEWAIRQACATAARWPADTKVAVNLSPAQFRNPGLLQSVVGAIAAAGLAPQRLELEITETVLLQDSEDTLATLYQLRGLGVRIAMDDFGTGYSSLSYLQSFPFDRIKIDRSFIQDVTEGVGSLNIVRAVAALAKGLGIETTAEGVETEEQLNTVRLEGCTEMQGFIFSKARSAGEIEQLYLAGRQPMPAAPPGEPGEDAALAQEADEFQPIAARAGAR